MLPQDKHYRYIDEPPHLPPPSTLLRPRHRHDYSLREILYNRRKKMDRVEALDAGRMTRRRAAEMAAGKDTAEKDAGQVVPKAARAVSKTNRTVSRDTQTREAAPGECRIVSSDSIFDDRPDFYIPSFLTRTITRKKESLILITPRIEFIDFKEAQRLCVKVKGLQPQDPRDLITRDILLNTADLDLIRLTVADAVKMAAKFRSSSTIESH
ncbi:uncharacterized protein K452DRAFT_291357 [Aplosporella prunicola CBS 121167]|uniref:Uncharacterized protein n=1 Tax=Aplosporella prunicola CBS 121167 TaxID=1176127 RepID=A0A6A6B1U6_9PEZI|nr:uncharacterized protein K452DRAFT_291357 [Aplosporella prunicola CBS 121167]KAF2137786.1 hypothetical protein K452DRAFT_291357 [Aplosporella prunicola CBS 121167]